MCIKINTQFIQTLMIKTISNSLHWEGDANKRNDEGMTDALCPFHKRARMSTDIHRQDDRNHRTETLTGRTTPAAAAVNVSLAVITSRGKDALIGVKTLP